MSKDFDYSANIPNIESVSSPETGNAAGSANVPTMEQAPSSGTTSEDSPSESDD